MKVADYIAEFLAEKKVPAVYELVGGMITFLVDSLHRHGQTKIISMHHEQGAAFAAEGAGRMTGIPGVAMATSGPGATNLLTGIGSCYFDSTPAVFITGQVNRFERKGNRDIRQLGFQETNIVEMVHPIVKRAWSVEEPEQIVSILEEAFQLATSGRPGPVLIDIPMDVQRAEIDPATCPRFIPEPAKASAMTLNDAQAIRDTLLRAKRPLILAGGGIQSAHALGIFHELVNILQVQVVHSLMAVDVLPWDHPMNAGMIGSYGNRWSNLAISEADVLLVLGSRLDVRQTGSDTEGFRGDRKIFHIDCEAGEINNRIQGCYAIISDLNPAIEMLLETLKPVSAELKDRFTTWTASIDALRREWPDVNELQDLEGINPNKVMHQLSHANCNASAFVVDVGQHQMWAAQSLEMQPGQRFLTSGGMGSMGFGLPAAIGAAIATPDSPVVMIAGDGSFQCNIQELQTVARLGLSLKERERERERGMEWNGMEWNGMEWNGMEWNGIKMVVINNQCHGMVRQFQQSYFEGRYQSTMWGYSAPNFEAVAAAYGIPARTVEDPTGVDDAVAWQAAQTGPSLLQVMISPLANAYPKLAFGKGMASMEPHVLSEEMEAT